MSTLKKLLEEKRMFDEEHKKERPEYFIEVEKDIKKNIQFEVVDELKKHDNLDDYEQEQYIDAIALNYFNKNCDDLSEAEKISIVEQLKDEVTGYSVLTPLLEDEDITEIMVNGPKQIYVEKSGKIVLSQYTFESNEHVRQVIDKIITPLGRRIDEGSPMVDARLPDGSRLNAIIPPLALNGPTITIRKFAKKRLGIDDLIKYGSLSPQMAYFLDLCVKARLNIFISGGTGSGKTTLLNVLSSFIPDDERIVTIEDAAELQLQQPHVLSLESRPMNVEGKGEVMIRDLVKNSLRMRPDRIIVGEVRSSEALDMLQSMNTGHDGSLATGHSNSPKDMLRRLETMVLMSSIDLPSRAIREQMASAIDIIVQQNRLRDGSRKITEISEITGMENDQILLQPIFKFNQKNAIVDGGVEGSFDFTNILPAIAKKFEYYGYSFQAVIDVTEGE